MWFAATQQKQSCMSHLNFIISFSPHLLLLPLFVRFLLASLYFFSFLPIANPSLVWGHPADFKRLVLHSKPWQMNVLSVSFKVNVGKERNACLWRVHRNLYLGCFMSCMNFMLMNFYLVAVQVSSTCLCTGTRYLIWWIVWMLCLNLCAVPK